jgi:hypothetical protein
MEKVINAGQLTNLAMQTFAAKKFLANYDIDATQPSTVRKA